MRSPKVRAALITSCVVLAVSSAACSKEPEQRATPTPSPTVADEISVDAIRESVSKDFSENLGQDVKSVDCPEQVIKGSAFQCRVTLSEQDNQVLIDIIPTQSGTVEWQVADKAASPESIGIEANIKEGVSAKTGFAVTSVICPPQIILKQSYKFTCVVTIGQEARAASVEITSNSGDYRWEYG